MKKESTRTYALRVVLLLLGLVIAHLGVTIFLLTDLGSDPFNVFVQGFFRSVALPVIPAITHGTVHLIISLIIIVILLFVDKSYIGIGTVLCMAFGGPIIDVYTIILKGIVNSSLPIAIRLALLVLGCFILAFGMTIVISSGAGTGPNDLVAVVISDKTKKSFGIVRIAVDVFFAGAGFLLGGVLGLGTVVCAFLVGPSAQLFFPISQKLCDSVLNKN